MRRIADRSGFENAADSADIPFLLILDAHETAGAHRPIRPWLGSESAEVVRVIPPPLELEQVASALQSRLQALHEGSPCAINIFSIFREPEPASAINDEIATQYIEWHVEQHQAAASLQQVYSSLLTQLNETDFCQPPPQADARILSRADVSRFPRKPWVKLRAALGGLPGPGAGLAGAMATEGMGRTYHTREDVETDLRLPLLTKGRWGRRELVVERVKRRKGLEFAEALHQLRTAPLLHPSEAIAIGRLADAAVFVVRGGGSLAAAVRQAVFWPLEMRIPVTGDALDWRRSAKVSPYGSLRSGTVAPQISATPPHSGRNA